MLIFLSFCQHGGGTVFKTLHWLVHSLESRKISLGAIVVEDQSRTSRLLRNYALEKKITMLVCIFFSLPTQEMKVRKRKENGRSKSTFKNYVDYKIIVLINAFVCSWQKTNIGLIIVSLCKLFCVFSLNAVSQLDHTQPTYRESTSFSRDQERISFTCN